MLNFLKNLSPFSKHISLAVIFLEYDRPEKGGSDIAFSTLQHYLAKLQGCQVTYLRVDNKNEEKPLQHISKNVYTLGGDNRYREFSGWQKGYENIIMKETKPDLLLFVNDMFLAPGESFLKDYATKQLLERSLSEQCIIGRIDSTGQQYTAYNLDVSKWVCTNCFFAPRNAIDTIRDIVTIKENLEDFLPNDFPVLANNDSLKDLALSIFKKDAPMNDTYKVWLVEWLTVRWHSKFEIDKNTWELFRTKVRNILNESLLSARLKNVSFDIQPYGNKEYY